MVNCNWCGCGKSGDEMMVSKEYCLDCYQKCARECITCHKPYPSLKFFVKNEKRCNSCQTRYLNQKVKKQNEKVIKGEHHSSPITVSSSSEEEEEEPEEEEELEEEADEIKQQQQQKLEELKVKEQNNLRVKKMAPKISKAKNNNSLNNDSLKNVFNILMKEQKEKGEKKKNVPTKQEKTTEAMESVVRSMMNYHKVKKGNVPHFAFLV
jgi:hypothetical protein